MCKTTFIEKCVNQMAHPEEIDDYIDSWHDGHVETGLHEFLGLTENEYASWIEHKKTIAEIIESRMSS